MKANLLLTQHARHALWLDRVKKLTIALVVISGWVYGMYTDSQA